MTTHGLFKDNNLSRCPTMNFLEEDLKHLVKCEEHVCEIVSGDKTNQKINAISFLAFTMNAF